MASSASCIYRYLEILARQRQLTCSDRNSASPKTRSCLDLKHIFTSCFVLIIGTAAQVVKLLLEKGASAAVLNK